VAAIASMSPHLAGPRAPHRSGAAGARRAASPSYFPDAGGGGLLRVEPRGADGLVGFFDCFGFFFSLLLRS